MTIAPAKNALRVTPPELRGNNLALGWCRERETCLDGPAGCVVGETRLYNPLTGEHTPIKELYEKKIAPTVQTLMGAMRAEVPFRKGVADLYRLTLVSGRKCIVTQNHLLLSDNSWIYLSACVPGTRLLISSPCPHPTTEAPGPLVSPQDALRLSQKPLGSQDGYPASHHFCGELPLREVSADLTPVPSQVGAHEHNHVGFCEDDRGFSQECSHHSQQSDPHARTCYSPSSDDTAYIQFRDRVRTSLQVDASSQYDVPSLIVTRLLSPIAQSLPDDDNMRLHALLLEECPVFQEVLSRGVMAGSTPSQLEPYSVFADMTPGLPGIPLQLRAYNPLSCTLHSLTYTCKYDYTIQWDTVSSIEYVRTDEYFDLHVPIAEHYLAEGIWHHNSGKTVGALYKIHVLLSRYPGSRALVARKTNTALSGSAMVTYRDNILRGRRDIHWFGGNKVEPAAFKYPNGSEMIVNGLDKPEKVHSAEFDWAYINEATECEIKDIEFVRIRLRPRTGGPPVPYRQLIMDCNPDAPTHWLNQRMNEGITTRLISRHEDNPRYWDTRTQDWTEEGREYIFGILGGLTGVRLARYRYGIWAAAEGTIYEDSWDRNRNVIDRFPIPADWPRYLSLDFGFTNPFVCGWWARDPDGRLICYREIYMTKRLVEDHAKQIKHYSRWGQDGGDPLPRELICDHDAEGRATLEWHLGLHTRPAHKAVLEGIQAVSSRLKPAGDGKPRLMWFRDALVERDMELAAKKKPTCTVEEMDTYVWKQSNVARAKEEPVKEDDHGNDQTRYIVARFDLRPTDVKYSVRIY